MIKLIERIGFFRLTLVPVGLLIIIQSFLNNLAGMGLVGLIVVISGFYNKCLLGGSCDVQPEIKKEGPERSKKSVEKIN